MNDTLKEIYISQMIALAIITGCCLSIILIITYSGPAFADYSIYLLISISIFVIVWSLREKWHIEYKLKELMKK